MSMRMASFLAGFGGGYLKADRQAKEDERQAKMDKIMTERADREKLDWEKRDNYEKGLAAAGAPTVAEQANDVLKDDDGNDMPAVPAFRADGKRFETMADAKAAADKANTPEAVNARQAAFMQAQGKPLEALQMQNAVMDSKLKRLGLTSAEGKFADEEFNRRLLADLNEHPDWTVGAAKLLTNTNVGGLKGMSVTARPSQDGKTVDFVGVGPDGAEKVLKTFNGGAEGMAEFLQSAGKTSFEAKVNYLVEQARNATAKAKEAKEDNRWERTFNANESQRNQAQENWQKTFDFNKSKEESDQQYKNRLLGFQANQDRRAAETHRIAMESEKVPAAVKLQATSLAEEMKIISSAMNKAMAEGSFDPNSANAKALIESQAMLRIQHRQLLEPHMPGGKGKGAADPLSLDKPAPGAAGPQATAAPKPGATPAPAVPAVSMQQVAPIDPGAQPVRQANEPLQAFKARLIQWDEARIANDALLREQKSEAQRKQLLQLRPDLARMSQGLR